MIRPALIVILFSGSVPATAQVRWEVREFKEACTPLGRYELSVEDDAFGPNVGMVRWLSPGRLAAADRAGKKVRVFDEQWKLLYTIGRPGGGPGELQSAADVAMLSDSTIAVADPDQMRIHLFTAKGRFLRSFTSNRFPADRLVGLPQGGIVAGGISDLEKRPQFLAIYSFNGVREKRTVYAPEPYASMAPRIAGAVLAARNDGRVVVVPAALDTIYLLEGERSTRFGLGLPQEYWKQVRQSDFDEVSMSMKVPLFGVMMAGGLIDDSTLALGWQTGRKAKDDMLGVVALSQRTGILFRGVPGALAGLHGTTMWILTDQVDESNVVQSYTCVVH